MTSDDELINSVKKSAEALWNLMKQVGLKALEKQIPKKPIEVPIISGDDMVCPECLVFVEDGAKYCSNCGQSLLWEENSNGNNDNN